MKLKGLSKKERIKSKKEFQLVYSAGKTLYSPKNKFKAIYYTYENSDEIPVKVAFAVYKKTGIAVWRNRVKRLMREAFRLYKYILIDKVVTAGKNLLVIFSPNSINQKKNKKIGLKDVLPEIVGLMKSINNAI